MRRVGRRALRLGALATAMVLALAQKESVRAQGVAGFKVSGGGITEPLGGLTGDAARGRVILFDQERGNCTICHPVPGGDARVQGNVGPTLAGVGRRLTVPELRLRVVDGTRVNAETIMPSYHRVEGLNRVGPKWRGLPILTAQEVEDVVAFLATLKADQP